jgi:alcohol dehydrogenase (cytochrome c)
VDHDLVRDRRRQASSARNEAFDKELFEWSPSRAVAIFAPQMFGDLPILRRHVVVNSRDTMAMWSTRTGFLLVALLSASSAHAEGSVDSDWSAYNRTLEGDRYSPLTEISASNVAGLHEICSLDLGDVRAFQTGPLVIGGTIYLTTDTMTFAIDGATCHVKWKNTRDYAPPSYLGSNRGAAFLDGRLFRGSGDAHVYAVDAATGKTVWDVAIGDAKKGESTPMAPIASNGVVYAGVGGGDNFGVTGRVYALSPADGHVLWKFDTVPDTKEVRATWGKASPAGAAVWTSLSLDRAAGVLYVPTGNPGPDFVKQLRPGQNLYANSVVALDAKSGAMIGYVQPVMADFHDWDVSSAPALVTTRKGRKLALVAAKDGNLYGIDRGAFGSAQAAKKAIAYTVPTTTHFNTNRPLTDKASTRFCPGSQGGSEWNGAAFHPGMNAVFVGAVDWCASVKLEPVATFKGQPGAPFTGSEPPAYFGKMDPQDKWRGWVTAVDADSGKVLWKFAAPAPILAGVTPTAGGVVFTGDMGGDVFALDARSGKQLWKGVAGGPMAGGVVSYATGGHQRVVIAAGINSAIWPSATKNARVVVLGLP